MFHRDSRIDENASTVLTHDQAGVEDTVVPTPAMRPILFGGSRLRRLTVPMPEVIAPPSTATLILVGLSMVGLVLTALITVAITRAPSPHYAGVGTPDSAVDACQVVSPDLATAAFGHSAGAPHFVWGTCVYDDGTQELIVQVARQSGRSLFEASRGASAQAVPGIGEAAYYANGRLWVLKGTSLLQVILGPVPTATPAPAVLTVANSAVGRL